MGNYILAVLLLVVFPSAPFVMMGCVATSSYVDELAKKQADTADILARIAELHADLAEELQSLQAKTARKMAFAAQTNADEAIDLSNESSGVDVSSVANKAITGDWVGLMGIIVSSLLGGGGLLYQQKQIKKHKQRADYNASLVDEVAELEPEVARKVAKAKKDV
jgi:hypothetical protein